MSMSDVKLTDAERQPCEVWTHGIFSAIVRV